MESQSEILFYTADDGKTKLQVRLVLLPIANQSI